MSDLKREIEQLKSALEVVSPPRQTTHPSSTPARNNPWKTVLPIRRKKKQSLPPQPSPEPSQQVPPASTQVHDHVSCLRPERSGRERLQGVRKVEEIDI